MNARNGIQKVNNGLLPYPAYDIPRDNMAATPARIRHYADVLLKRKWLILAVVLVCVTLAFINALTETPIYKALATIQINFEKTKILPYQEIKDTSPFAATDKFLQTQCSVLQSRSLATRVIRKLGLDTNRDFIGKAPLPLAKGKNDTAAAGSGELDPVYADRLLRNLEVTPSVQRTQIIQISYNSPNPGLAANVANTLTKEYIQLNLENQYDATQQAMEFLSKQINEMRTKVTQADEALLAYARTYDLTPPSDKEKSPVQQELFNLKMALSDAKLERIRKESQYKILKEAGPDDPIPSAIKNGRISALEEKLYDLKQREASLNQRFRAGWPERADLQAQMEELERQLEEEKGKVLNILKKDYAEAVQRENMLNQAADKQQALSMLTQENSIQYNILRREVEINRQLLETMLQRLKEATVSSSLSASNVTILDRAEVPRLPFKPNKKMQLLYGLLVGLALGFGLALTLDHVNDTVRTPEDVNALVQLPVLGIIPMYARSAAGPGGGPSLTAGNGHSGRLSMCTVTYDHGRSPISEAFRVVRTSLLLSNVEPKPRIILVTSPMLEDGKTTLSHNIAIALTQVNRPTVLLDCDMRRPRIHKTFELDNEVGMSTYLSEEIDLESVIQETRIPRLFVIPSGPIPANPAELLMSARFSQALEELSKRFDYVIIDSPPLLMVTDGYIISSLVDGVVLVAKADKSTKDSLQRTRQYLNDVNANVLGVVLNKMDARGARYGYGGYYAYAESNGNGKGKGKRDGNAAL